MVDPGGHGEPAAWVERTTVLVALPPQGDGVLAAAGFPCPAMNRWTEHGGVLLARVTPNQVLAMRAGSDAPLLDELAPLEHAGAGLVDWSDARVGLRVAGPGARARLAHLVPLDLDDISFPVGACAQTVAAHLAVTLLRLGPTEYELQAGRSFAATAARAVAAAHG